MELENTNKESRPQFGGRVLKDESEVFKHNAWDNVEWDEEQNLEAKKIVDKAASSLMNHKKAQEYENNASDYWDKFYSIHQNRFFKERNWLFTEFPDLAPGYKGAIRVFEQNSDSGNSEGKRPESDNIEAIKKPEIDVLGVNQEEVDNIRHGETYFGSNSNFRLLEVGCGTGSTVYPILEMNSSPDLVIYCCDLSSTAVNLVKEHPSYKGRRCYSWVCDVTQDWNAPFTENSLDVITLIFVLSAISPGKMKAVVEKIYKYLKPGGLVMFRDYGRYDLAQLRFKEGKCIQDNFYARGDGTLCYFFTQEDVKDLFVSKGFVEEQNLVDRRLQVNRGKKIKNVPSMGSM